MKPAPASPFCWIRLGFAGQSFRVVACANRGGQTVRNRRFEVRPDNKIYDIAAEYDLEVDGDIIIKRTISADGRGKILFNDQIITLKLLRELSRCLIEIHGQHDNQGLLNPATHCDILDSCGACGKELAAVREAFSAYKTAAAALRSREEALNKAKEDEENLKHWVQELNKLAPKKVKKKLCVSVAAN